MWLTFAAALANEACEDSTEAAISTARELEAAFLQAEEEKFLRLHNEMAAAIPCMVTVPPVLDVAQLHRSMAIWQFVSGQLGPAKGSFAAVQQLSPNWSMLTWGLPENHPMWPLWNESPKDTARKSLRTPPGGWFIDGREDTTLPASRPALVQGYYADGKLWYAAIVSNVAEIPEVPVDESVAQRRRTSIHIIGTALSSTMLGGGLGALGVGIAKGASLKQETLSSDDVLAAVSAKNTLLVSGSILTAAGATTGALTWGIRW